MSSAEKKQKLLEMAAEYRRRALLDRGKADKWASRASTFDRHADTLESLAREV